MAIAIQTQSISPSKFHPLVKVKHQLFAPFQRLWWHTHAYTVIFGVITLAVLSVIMLYIHDQLNKALSTLRNSLPPSSSQVEEISAPIKQQN